ncbi:MAG: crossover junction endodeoxyribonuclease RuvC [Chitinophagia bacterium]|jgi:crossover junction endodeoxyribonuclease RuvC|nr:crossover junction endodeoxyribonuclease RuvC [Chitinophagia bacterium]
MSNLSKSPLILGIDPGTQILGYAILKGGAHPELIEMDVLKLTKEKDIYARLEMIHVKMVEIIQKYQPSQFAIEAPFFGKNIQSMLKLGRAQGVAIAAAMQFKLPVTEYAPKKVKQSITGNGNADKDMVWKMLERILQLKKQPKYYDATDALAVALCHWYQISSPALPSSKGLKGWNAFLAKNPNRIKK